MLEIDGFEQQRRQLATKVFSSEILPDLTNAETDLLMNYLSSGTHGTFENAVRKKLKDRTKLSFWWHSVFLPRKEMEQHVPFSAKSPLLYPAAVVWRFFRVLIFKQDKRKQTMKIVKKYGK